MNILDNKKKYEFVTKTNFSVIYKFKNKDEQNYILKVIPKNKNKKEIDICSVLPNHKNIIQYMGLYHEKKMKLSDFNIYDDYNFLIFEYFDGITLSKFMKEYNNKLPPSIIKKIFYQILNAIQQLHKNKIIHNDIKLDNILINKKTFQIKLIDFGLSSFGQEHVDKSIYGSLPYLAPEIISSKIYSIYSDIWALGIVLFTLVEGRFPFCSNDRNIILDEIKSFKVKTTIKKVYNTKFNINNSNFSFFSSITNRSFNNHHKNEMKTLMELSILCLKSIPNKRPLIDDLLNFQIFHDIYSM